MVKVVMVEVGTAPTRQEWLVGGGRELGCRLPRIPIEGIDFAGADVAHQQRRIVRS
jgi:hypothetical protein